MNQNNNKMGIAGILEWIKTTFELIWKLDGVGLTRFVVFIGIVILGWRCIALGSENKDLIIENREFDTQCNIRINQAIMKVDIQNDSLKAVIVDKDLKAQLRENQLLQDKYDELKKIQQNVNKVAQVNERIINNQK